LRSDIPAFVRELAKANIEIARRVMSAKQRLNMSAGKSNPRVVAEGQQRGTTPDRQTCPQAM
jgi:hypothetical protein